MLLKVDVLNRLVFIFIFYEDNKKGGILQKLKCIREKSYQRANKANWNNANPWKIHEEKYFKQFISLFDPVAY